MERVKKALAPDLDIFNNQLEEVTDGKPAEGNDDAKHGDAQSNGESLFAGNPDFDEPAAKPDAKPEDKAKEDAKSDDTKVKSDEKKETPADEKKEDAKIEELDPELSKLFEDLEKGAEKNGNDAKFMKLLDEAQSAAVERDLTIAQLTKKNEILERRLMESSGSDAETAPYRKLIEKVDAEPRLNAVVRLWGEDNERAKSRLTSLLSELVKDVTGEDVSDLLHDQQKKKALSVMDDRRSTGARDESKKEPTEVNPDSLFNLGD
jgi:hypothetical protein